MGLVYLDDKSWADVTREERFFCAQLHHLIRGNGIQAFVKHLANEDRLKLDITANWEIAYEACFYRDLWQHRGQAGELYSPKRTFDLCLLSDNAIVIIEAKAQQEFEVTQVKEFVKDKDQLKKETNVATVILVGLASSKYQVPDDIRREFDCLITWADIARFYNDDAILHRADVIYAPGGCVSFGKNNTSGYLYGADLIRAFKTGEEFMVGRAGGLTGKILLEDIMSGNWTTQGYETNRDSPNPPNSNWFRLSDFARKVSELTRHNGIEKQSS